MSTTRSRNPRLLPFALACTAVLAGFSPLAGQRQDPAGMFEVEVEHTRLPAVSQGRTGTCWSFATTSFIESELERAQGSPIRLSPIHTVFHAYLEKAERFVRLHGKAQFGEGGLCHDVMFVVERNGFVPEAVFSGMCEGDTHHDHSEMVAILERIVDKVATGKRPSDKWKAAVRGVLCAYLGPVPEEFEYHGKRMTPREFALEVMKFRPADYRQVASQSGQEFGKPVELLVPDNWMRHQGYWNVPVQEMIDALDAALRKGYTAAIDIDVSEPGRDNNVWTLPGSLEKKGAITDAMRKTMFDRRETTDDHLMHVVGIARHRDGRTFYLTKNSWGGGGPFKGHDMISRNYMMAKLLSFMVHKDGLSAELRARFE